MESDDAAIFAKLTERNLADCVPCTILDEK